MKSPIFKEICDKIKAITASPYNADEILDMEKKVSVVVAENREALVTAWVAETGLLPSDSVVCHGYLEGHFRMWVESRAENDKRAKAPIFPEEL